MKVGDLVEEPSRASVIYRAGLVLAFSHGSKKSGGTLVEVLWRGEVSGLWHPVAALRKV